MSNLTGKAWQYKDSWSNFNIAWNQWQGPRNDAEMLKELSRIG